MPNPPKFEPRHRIKRVGPLQLPKEGRKGPTPDWPLEGEPTMAEARAWSRIWATPQAVTFK